MPLISKIKNGARRLKNLVHLPCGGRAPEQPPPPSVNDDGQTNIVTSVPVPPVSPPPGPSKPPAPNPARGTKRTAWAALETSLGLLQESANAFGPLKTAVGGISRCVEILERAAQSREDYEALATELDLICKDLYGYLGGSTPPSMTASIDSLAKGIDREIMFVVEKQGRNNLERVAKAMDDADEVLQCYSRIQRLLERLVRNANMATWRIVDEQATTNRLERLPYSPAAKYRSAESANLRGEGCIENTRVDVLQTLRSWAYDGQREKIYWLNGMAGTSKTTIADSLCAQLKGTGTLAASFFCSRQLPTCHDVNRIFPSISYQLAQFSSPFRHALSRVLELDSDAHNQPVVDQFEQLIAEPLRQVENTIPNDLVVVIDALDESVDQDGVDRILAALLSRASHLPIKFFVTSRPESKIRDRMLNPDDEQSRSVLHLHDLERSTVQADIKTYLQVKLKRIGLRPADLEHLVERSGVLFIYAATLVRYIGADNFSRSADRLELVLNTSTSSSSDTDATIDELYSTILYAAFHNAGLNGQERVQMRRVLHTVVCAQEPLTVDVLARLLGLGAKSSVGPALRPLFSVLHVSETSELVTTFHQSFPDYMFHQERSKEFYCDKHQHNGFLAEQCFRLIETPDPPFNICGLESSYLFDEDMPDLGEKIQNAISPELFYACRYWGAHLELVETSAHLPDALRKFLSLRLLLWMEVLNLKKRIHIGVGCLQRVHAWSQTTNCPVDIQQLARDAWGFVAAFSSNPVSRSTPHLYISALPFWPEQRPISKHYSQRMQGLPKATGTAMRRRESAPLAICVTPSQVLSVSYSPDGARIVSGCADNMIRIWDAHTGRMIGELLEGHSGLVWSVAYSPDGGRIVSGSTDKAIRIWDAHTRKAIGEPLKGHTDLVRSVAYSSDGALIVSGSLDNTIRIWDALTGKMIGEPLEGHASGVYSVAYSPDDAHIVSGSGDGAIRIWDASTGKLVGEPLEGHTSTVRAVVYSSDGARLTSGSSDNSIRIWDARSGKMIGKPLEGHTSTVRSAAYSSDSTHIVSCSEDKTIRIWDAHTGKSIGEPLEGHAGKVWSVAYSSDGARIVSGSNDKTIRIWDAHTGKMISEGLEGHAGEVWSVAYSSDGARIVSGSSDKTIRMWDGHTGKMIGEPLEGHTEGVQSVAYSFDGARIVSGSWDKTIRIWDAHTGEMVGEPLQGHTDEVLSVAYSFDGARIVSGSLDNTIRTWDAHTGQMIGEPLQGHTNAVCSVAYSPDSTRIVSGSWDDTIRIWDAHSGETIGEPLQGHTSTVCSVAYSPDGKHIVSGSWDHTIRIWDAHTGQMIGEPLQSHAGLVLSVAYSSDGTRIISGSYDRTIRIWDAHTGQMIGEPLKGHTGPVYSVAYSSDGTRIVSGSYDQTIRIWDARVGKMIGEPPQGHTDAVNLAVSSSNSAHAVSHSYNNTASIVSPEHSNHTSSDPWDTWEVDQDGYMLANGSQVVMCIPPDVRHVQIDPRNTAVISAQGSAKIDLTNARIGDSWAQCYQPM